MSDDLWKMFGIDAPSPSSQAILGIVMIIGAICVCAFTVLQAFWR